MFTVLLKCGHGKEGSLPESLKNNEPLVIIYKTHC